MHTLTGTNSEKGLPSVFGNDVYAQSLYIGHNLWKKTYPLWHTYVTQNPTLSGTLLENPSTPFCTILPAVYGTSLVTTLIDIDRGKIKP